MKRQIIRIDGEKCNGCGLCVEACHEGAIGLVEGKASLLRDDYCDGLGNCLPACPTGAITFENREALEYNETEVKKHMEQKNNGGPHTDNLPCGCPGTNAREITRGDAVQQAPAMAHASDSHAMASQLRQWPVQIKLVPVNASYFENAHLLISADCAAYAYGNFHNEFIRKRIALIGCPKLDECDYSEKLIDILASNSIKSVTVVRMEVPCCSGLENAVVTALKNCGKMIPWQVVIMSTDGRILE